MRRVCLAVVIFLSLFVAQACAVSATAAKHPRKQPPHLKWPREIISKARSANGKIVAVYDPTGFYLADENGKHERKLQMSLGDLGSEGTTVDFSFNKKGTILAVLAGGWYGEPHVSSDKVLWSVDTKTGHVRRVSEWADSLLGAGPREVAQRLGAWSRDGESIQISAEMYYLTDGTHDMRYLGVRTFWVEMTNRPVEKTPAKR